MQFTINGLDLSDAVLTVIKATSPKSPNPILEGIKIKTEKDNIVLTATDLELSIIKRVKAEIKEEGEIIVPGNFFNNYIRKLNDKEIEIISLENNQIKIKYDENEGYIQCLNASDFPIIKEIDNNDSFTIKQENLKKLINKSIFCVSQDDSRPILKGCLIKIKENQIYSISLDGYRLALINEQINEKIEEKSFIVPARSLGEISKLLNNAEDNVKIYVTKNYLLIDIDNTQIITRLLEGEFINYEQILPKEFNTDFIVNKTQIFDALERASLLAKIDKNNLVKFEISKDGLVLTSNSEIGNIKENLTIKENGNDLTIAFNVRYFIESLREIDDDFILIKLNSSVSPCIIVPQEGNEYLYLILPVRLV